MIYIFEKYFGQILRRYFNLVCMLTFLKIICFFCNILFLYLETVKKTDNESISVHPLITRLQSTLHHLTNFIIICIIVTIMVLSNYQPSFTGNSSWNKDNKIQFWRHFFEWWSNWNKINYPNVKVTWCLSVYVSPLQCRFS